MPIWKSTSTSSRRSSASFLTRFGQVGAIVVAGLTAFQSSVVSASSPTVMMGKTECRANDRYYVIELNVRGEDPRIIVKTKVWSTDTFACVMDVFDGDFEATGGSGYYVRDLKNRFLIVEDGPPPGRRLVVFNLETRMPILDAHFYSDGGQWITDTDVTFWSSRDMIPGACKRESRNLPPEGGVVMEEETIFTFATGKSRKTGRKRCIRLGSDLL